MILNVDTVGPVVDLPFVVLHISMIVFLFWRRRKDFRFRNAFFTLYLIVSMADVLIITSMTVFVNSLNAGIGTETLLACRWCPKLLLELVNYSSMVQTWGHTLVALNRLSCFCSEALHSKIWNGRSGTFLCLALAVLPVFKIAFHMPYAAGYIPLRNGGLYGAYYMDPGWSRTSLTMDGLIYAVCALISFVASMAAVLRLYGLRSKQHEVQSSDARLLAYSIVMFVLQLLMTLMYLTWAHVIVTPVIAAVVGSRYVVDAYSLSGPVFLLLLSARVRSKYLHFYRLKRSKGVTSNVTVTRVRSMREEGLRKENTTV